MEQCGKHSIRTKTQRAKVYDGANSYMLEDMENEAVAKGVDPNTDDNYQ